ncbi:hypothetical protein Zmor_018467 [Zophobas morio]|uniref:CRAL-TRIO domain-containing protein n=3 Tax=Zophobas morio TaxID=2755281 RepID=A0AA38IBQ3_9CUCU|nr:hypothetical protein Zmor_018467 [Zophobas morio]
MEDVFKLAFMTIAISQMYSPPDNQIVLIDMEGITLMHLTCIKLTVLKNFIDFLQDAIPLRITKIHFFNVNYVAEKAIAISKLFMKKQLVETMEIHPTSMKIEEFHQKWIPATHLPKEYGGDLPSYIELNDKSNQYFRKLKPFFEAEEKLVADCDLSYLPK